MSRIAVRDGANYLIVRDAQNVALASRIALKLIELIKLKREKIQCR